MKRFVALCTAGVLAMALSPVGGATAASSSCRARNATLGTASSPDLQAVIDAACPGDTIQVKRVCVGNFRIAKDLTLVGEPTDRIRRPILDGNGAGPVVSVIEARSLDVTLINLTITGGYNSCCGAGIENIGRLMLERSSVVGNAVDFDGGGILNYGRLILRDSTVRSNSALLGGGIANFGGKVVLNRSSVIDNVSLESAGGIANDTGDVPGTLVLRNSVVRGNKAYVDGGGIQNFGDMTMHGSSLVTGNRADYSDSGNGLGGGIDNCGTLTGDDDTNVRDNYLGSTGIFEDNISPCLAPPNRRS